MWSRLASSRATVSRVSRAEDADRELDELYAQVPDIDCKGHCWDACGPIDAGLRERVRLARAGVRLPTFEAAQRASARTVYDYRCPALSDDNRCTVYEIRPMICRIWGATRMLRCQWGCKPRRGQQLLTDAETMMLLDAAEKAGTAEPRSTLEFWRRKFADPKARRQLAKWVPQPKAVDPAARRRP